ncbi:MAG: ATP phosphoribosyltransferase [Gemmatimonadaceae bacterium]
MVRLALPSKGRLADEARAVVTDAGLSLRAQASRELFTEAGAECQALFVRAQDIPEFVADGAADAGITGWDLVCESRRPLRDRLDLQFGSCRLVLAVPEESPARTLSDVLPRSRVATTFPNLTSQFFYCHAMEAQIVPISGAVESAPHLGIADAVVDLSSSGSTLRANGLREIATVLESSARLISRVHDVADEVDGLVATIASVVRARSQRYVMANMPRVSLDRVRAVLPGLNGPTVTEILDGGEFVAVHAVVGADQLSSAVASLKALGGQGILVTRIERLLP